MSGGTTAAKVFAGVSAGVLVIAATFFVLLLSCGCLGSLVFLV